MNNPKPMTKKERLLRFFIELGAKGLNAEEAFPLGTTCLHTDISLFKNDGVVFCRTRETLTRTQGGTKSYNRYWLSAEMVKKAKEVVDRLAKNRSI